MIIELILTAIIISLLVYHFLYVKELNKQIIELTKVAKARDLTEYTINQDVEKQDEAQAVAGEPDLIPIGDADAELIEKMLGNQFVNDEDE